MSNCLTSVSKWRKSVSISPNVSEFGRKYFCFPGIKFCFGNKMFADVGDRETFEQTFKITNFNLFLDRVNCMYIYIFSILFDAGGFFTSHKFVLS